MFAVNSSIDSTDGCDTLSTYPKLPNVVSMPSTLTFTPTACAPGVIHLRRRHLLHARHRDRHDARDQPGVARFLITERRLVGSLDDLLVQ